jgi:hypothetical protein
LIFAVIEVSQAVVLSTPWPNSKPCPEFIVMEPAKVEPIAKIPKATEIQIGLMKDFFPLRAGEGPSMLSIDPGSPFSNMGKIVVLPRKAIDKCFHAHSEAFERRRMREFR